MRRSPLDLAAAKAVHRERQAALMRFWWRMLPLRLLIVVFAWMAVIGALGWTGDHPRIASLCGMVGLLGWTLSWRAYHRMEAP